MRLPWCRDFCGLTKKRKTGIIGLTLFALFAHARLLICLEAHSIFLKASHISRQFAAVLSVLVMLMLAYPAFAGAEVVYDNTATPTKSEEENPWLPDGFWPFNAFAPNEQMGDQIILSGTARSVVEFDLLLSSTQAVSLSSLTLRFYDLQIGSQGYPEPKNQLWTHTLTDVAVDGLTTVNFVVPEIVVPDIFVWTTSADSGVAGMATFDPPTVGSSGDFFWDFYGNAWCPLYFYGDPAANFGAKVTAIPEPVTAGLLAIGGLSLIRRRRR